MVSNNGRAYLGLDLSTQQLKAVVVDDGLQILHQAAVQFDSDLPEFRTHGGVVIDRNYPHVVTAPTLMWVKAVDMLMDRLTVSGVDYSKIAAISGAAQVPFLFWETLIIPGGPRNSIPLNIHDRQPKVHVHGCVYYVASQDVPWVAYFGHLRGPSDVVHLQHGSVYWQNGSEKKLQDLDPSEFIHQQLATSFSVTNSPVWMDSSTSSQCKELEDAVGGPQKLAEVTGSRAYQRFTGSQIAKIAQTKPDAYRATERISLVSSFLCSLFLGKIAPIDIADGSGMNLMDIQTKNWDQRLLDVCGPSLGEKLGKTVPSTTNLGTISSYYVERWDFNADCRIIAFTGDNPASLIGMRLHEGWLAMSLGTSDTVFLWLKEPKVVLDGHIMCNPVDPEAFFAMLCFKNGSLTRERIRNNCTEGSWDIFNQLLDSTPRGNFGNIGLYYDRQEIIPYLAGDHRYNKAGDKVAKFTSLEVEVRALIEGQFVAKRAYAEDIGCHLGKDTKILATGGASSNKSILQVIADVFNAPVYVQEAANSAMLGTAYQAKIGLLGKERNYDEITSCLPPPQLACEPYPDAVEIYGPMVKRYRSLVAMLTQQQSN